MKLSPLRSKPSGFTLFELVLAMGLLTILVGMVFGTARTSLALGNSIVKSQNEEMLHQAFFELLHQRLSDMPGNARFDLKVTDSGSHYLSDLTLEKVPLSFTWGGQARIAKSVQLSTVKRRSGYLDIVLRYYDEELIANSNSTVKKLTQPKPFAEIVLLEDVAYFEWRVLDGRSMEWKYDWDLDGRQPLQVELTLAIGANGEEIRQVFWIPAKQNPEILIRQLQTPGGSDFANSPNAKGGLGPSGPDGTANPANPNQPPGRAPALGSPLPRTPPPAKR
jgi:Type II secretion system (T2SS), protein J/Prokaryotic N-terminal methylation motif